MRHADGEDCPTRNHAASVFYKMIATSSFVDVLEMDATSHGKVDDMQDLVKPVSRSRDGGGRYKVCY